MFYAEVRTFFFEKKNQKTFIDLIRRRNSSSIFGLRLAVAVAGLVPVGAGLAGMLTGTMMLGVPTPLDVDSHYRYLSGLLLAIGLAFWSTIPRISRSTQMFRLLTGLVFVGGIGRLIGVFSEGVPSPPMLGGLAMELVITPLLCLWQDRIAWR